MSESLAIREAAEALADATDTYLNTTRSPEMWATDRARLWSAALEVRAALAETPVEAGLDEGRPYEAGPLRRNDPFGPTPPTEEPGA